MFNIKKSLAFGLIAGVGMLSSMGAHAVVVEIPTGSTWEQTLLAFGGTSFSNSFLFALGGASDLNGLAELKNLSEFTVSLTQGSSESTIISPTFTPSDSCQSLVTCSSAYGYTGLGPGTYKLVVSGKINDPAVRAGFETTFNITPAVPEPATAALALVAAGLLGSITLRNSKIKSKT